MRLFTIGHSIATLEQFVDWLRENQIDLLVDVRSKPRRRLAHFDQVPVETGVQDAGIRYRFLGNKLGGVPQDARVRQRWRQGHLDPLIVAHLRSTEEWAEGIDELARLIGRSDAMNVCIMCSEQDEKECHRKAVALDVAKAVGDLQIVHLHIGKSATSEVGVQEVLI